MRCDRHNEIVVCYFCGRTESQSHDKKPDRITNLENKVEALRVIIVDAIERLEKLESSKPYDDSPRRIEILIKRTNQLVEANRDLQQRIQQLENNPQPPAPPTTISTMALFKIWDAVEDAYKLSFWGDGKQLSEWQFILEHLQWLITDSSSK